VDKDGFEVRQLEKENEVSETNQTISENSSSILKPPLRALYLIVMNCKFTYSRTHSYQNDILTLKIQSGVLWHCAGVSRQTDHRVEQNSAASDFCRPEARVL
jgi:hypothetical protein